MRDLPAPLPPAVRTMGQLIAESIRAYSGSFWKLLPLGLPLALVDQASVRESTGIQALFYWGATPLFAAAFVWASAFLHGKRPTWGAFAIAVLIWLPFPALRLFYILPGLAWLAFIGMAVPAALVENLRFRDALVRGRQLGVADYAHSLGSLAALVVVVGVAGNTLSSLLHTQGDNGQRIALFLSDLVLSPLLFIGGALLYVDQAARLGSREDTKRRRRDADLHPAVEPDPAGRTDPQVEP